MTWRLVPAAGAGWLTGLAGIAAVAGGAAPGIVIVLLLAVSVCCAVSACVLAGLRRWVVVPALLVAAAIALSTIGFVQAVATGPVVDAASEGRRVTAQVTVIGDLRMRTSESRFSGEQAVTLEARAHLDRLAVGSQAWQVGAPILLRMSPQAAPVIGSTLEVTGELQAGDPLRGTAAVLEIDDTALLSPPGVIAGAAQMVRTSLRAALTGGDPRATALVEGLAIGDETSQPPGLADDMRVSGLSHLTAVSGGNTALVVGAVLLVTGLVGMPLLARVLLSLVALAGFVVIVGPQPSVLRAGVMGVIALIALATGEQRTGMAALAFAVIVLLVLSPGLAVSWGFALSVWATIGLLVLSGPLTRRWGGDETSSRARRAIAQALALTVAAQVATAPLIAAFGNGLSLVAVPANLLAAPAVAPVTILGLLAALTGPVAPPAARVLAHLAEPPAAWIAWLAETGAAMPAATLPWPGGLTGAALATLAAAALVVVWRRRRGRHERRHVVRMTSLGAVALAVVAILVLRVPDRAGWPPPGWVLVACDVGQGDALVIRTEIDSAVVVDAGPDPEAIDRCLTDLGVERIPLLVLTHHHIDHVAGIPGILDGRVVERALVSPLREPAEQAAQVDSWLAGIRVDVAAVGDRRSFGDVHLTTLWPQRIIRGAESAPNNASVVVLVDAADVRMLLLGDVEIAAQVALRSSLGMDGVDVVKVAHHGSRVQDPALAAWTAGRVAIVSVGAGNPYGHPAQETIDTWSGAGAVIARTDLGGDVAIVGEPLGVVTRRTEAR